MDIHQTFPFNYPFSTIQILLVIVPFSLGLFLIFLALAGECKRRNKLRHFTRTFRLPSLPSSDEANGLTLKRQFPLRQSPETTGSKSLMAMMQGEGGGEEDVFEDIMLDEIESRISIGDDDDDDDEVNDVVVNEFSDAANQISQINTLIIDDFVLITTTLDEDDEDVPGPSINDPPPVTSSSSFISNNNKTTNTATLTDDTSRADQLIDEMEDLRSVLLARLCVYSNSSPRHHHPNPNNLPSS